MNECQDFSPEKSPAVRLVQMSRVTQMKIVKGKKRKKKEKKGLVLSFLGVWVGGGGTTGSVFRKDLALISSRLCCWISLSVTLAP